MISAFTLDVLPKPSNKRRAAMVGGHARVVQDAGVRAHQTTVAAMAAQYRPRQDGQPVQLSEPVSVRIVAVIARPKRLMGSKWPSGRIWCGSRPDADNLAKSVLDGLRDWWTDDSIVAELLVQKLYAAKGESPRYEVKIYALADA